MLTMPTHEHLRLTSREVYDDLRHHTRQVRAQKLPSVHVTKHYDALLTGGLDRNNAKNGKRFEICILDALLHFGVPPLKIEVCKQPPYGQKAEADFHITLNNGFANIYAKTSLRERWAQPDRAALLWNMTRARKRHHYCVFYNEYPRKWDCEQNEAFGNRTTALSAGGMEVFPACADDFDNMVYFLINNTQ